MLFCLDQFGVLIVTQPTPIPPKSPKSYKAKTLGTSLNNSLTVPHIPSLYSTPLLYPSFLISTILVPKPGNRRTTGPLSVAFNLLAQNSSKVSAPLKEQQQKVITSAKKTAARCQHRSKEQQHGVSISTTNSSRVSASRQRTAAECQYLSKKNSRTVSASQQRTAAECQHLDNEQQSVRSLQLGKQHEQQQSLRILAKSRTIDFSPRYKITAGSSQSHLKKKKPAAVNHLNPNTKAG